MQTILLVLISAIWVIAIAILSVQNATPVTIRFLGLQSVEMPFGVALSMFVAGGMTATVALLLLFKPQKRRR